MQSLSQLLKCQLQQMQQLLKESKSKIIININILAIFYVSTRFSLLLPLDQFADTSYLDSKFILFKTLINWFSLLSPLNSIKETYLKFAIVIIICIIHWISTAIVVFGSQQSQVLQAYAQYYFTYLQTLILYPSIIHIINLKNSGDYHDIVIITLIPIVFNSLLQTYIQRNYSLPTKNYVIKRHKMTNYFVVLIEIIGLISIIYLEERYQCIIMIFIFFIQVIDSFFGNPYQYFFNIQYCLWSCILLFGSILKQIIYFWDPHQFFYVGIYFIPMFSIVLKKFLMIQLEEQFQSSQLKLEILLSIVDMYYSGNLIIKNKIVQMIQQKYQIIVKVKLELEIQLQNCIMQLFQQMIEQLHIIDISNEDFYIYQILFYYTTCEKYNLGFITLKQYQSQSKSYSLFFSILAQNIFQSVQKQIKKKIIHITDEQQGALSLQQIQISQILNEKSINYIIQILQQKLKFWIKLQKGYKRIEELASQAKILSNQIMELKKLVFLELQINVFQIQKDLFKLNILDLRLLSLIFSAALNDYHISLIIEQRIEEIISFERNLQTKNVLNTSLLNDEVILVTASLIKEQGKIIIKNRAKIKKFFRYPDDDEYMQIHHINQLLPKYLLNKHDKFINDFLKVGESEIFDLSRDVYPVYFSGFSFSGTLQLVHSFESLNDYIVTAALKTSNENFDFILFDETGKIQGISKQIQKLLLITDDYETISNLIQKSYIYFWFHDLFDKLQDCIKDNQKEKLKQFRINQEKKIISPIHDLEGLIKGHEIYRKQHFLTQTNSVKTEIIEQQSEKLEKQSEKIICFQKNYLQRTTEFVTSYSLKEQSNQIYYEITFNVELQLIKQKYPMFILLITDYRLREIKKNDQTCSQSLQTTFKDHQIQQSEQIFTDSNFQLEVNDNSQNIIFNQPVINKLFNNSQDQILNQIVEFKLNYGISQVEQKSIDQRESNLISPRGNKDILIQKDHQFEDDDDDNKEQKSKIGLSSSQKEQKIDILELVLREQENAPNQMRQQPNKTSITSGTSDKTQNSVYNLIRKLSNSNNFQTSIIKVIVISIFLTIFLLILVISEIAITRQNTDQLKFNIPLVRIPQRFNRLYCTFVTLGQLELQLYLLNQSYGEMYEYRIKNESAIRIIEMQTIMIDLKNEFAKLQHDGRLPIVKIRIINQYSYKEINTTMLEFDQMIHEKIDSINEHLQNTDDNIQNVEKIQILVQFLKGNLINQLSLTIKLVEEIENEFFGEITYFETEYFIFLLVSLMIIFFLIILQFKQWHQPYLYMQSVLLLISRIAEKDIEYSQSKFQYICDILEKDSQKWKHLNFFREVFWYSKITVSQSAKFFTGSITQSLSKGKSNNYKVKSVSRIQDTNFRIINIYIILVFLWILLSSFVLSIFLIKKQNMDNSHPELQLAMEYVRFKQDLDGAIIISQLLKNQQILIDETMASGIFKLNPELNTKDKYFKTLYDELLNQFVVLQTDIGNIFKNIYNDVVASKKISQKNKDLLLNLYEQDLCQIIPEQLPFCVYENGYFKYYSTYPQATSQANNRMIFKYGINGIFQTIQQIFNTHYSLELNGIKDTNLTLVNKFLQSPEYIQVILSYSFDVSFALLQFYYTIIQSSLDILEDDFQMVTNYTIGFGLCSLLILYFIIILRAITLQKQVQQIRQTLIIIPHESLQDQSILNAIRKIDRSN